MTINSPLIDDVVNLYIYGLEEKPSDLVTDTLIRGEKARAVYEFDVNRYMEGPGRFARGSMSSLVDEFFRPDIYDARGKPLPFLAPGSYSKDQLKLLFGNKETAFYFQQYNYQDETDDVITQARNGRV